MRGLSLSVLVTLLGACGDSAPATDTAVSPLEAEAAEKVRPTWWYTCGDPVCSGWTRDRSIPLCGLRTEGSSCAPSGGECDIRGDACNTHLRCGTTDPTADGCPISLRSYKRDIRYLSAAETDAVRDDLLAVPLATWAYTAEGAGASSHLGFIIDDLPDSPAVAVSGDHVDLYGYTSMTVAALQAQQREIEALRAEVEGLKAAIKAK